MTNMKKFRNQAAIDCFEDEDIIIPDSLYGEFLYIYYVLWDIYKFKESRKKKLLELKRQIKFFFICWDKFVL